jgi:hypothetical protein
MIVFTLLTSLGVVIAAYLALSRYERNYVNILMPFMLIGIANFYLFELAYGMLLGFEGSTYAYVYTYVTHAAGVLAKVLAYIATPAIVLPILIRTRRITVPLMPVLLLLCSLALYAPVLIEFAEFITSPREIYAATRIGYGALFFLSTFVLYFAFILLLFSGRISRTYLWLFALAALIILYLHGSKVQVLSLFLIGLYFVVFVKGRRFGFGQLLGLGAGVSAMVLTLFYLTFPATMREDFVLSLASYAEATRFGAKVMDDPTLQPQLGRLALESNFYGVVPRALVPDKPRDFGTFWLTSRYAPERFEAATGSPDFGLGVPYADFGVFAIVYHVLGQLLAGILLKVLVTRLRLQPDAGTFVLFLVFMGVPLIPTGSGVPLILYFALAHVAKVFSRDQPATVGPGAKYRAPRPPVDPTLGHA